MDFDKLIDKNEYLKEYFTEFPKKLKKLATEGKIIKFCGNGIEVNPKILRDYLLSKESIFPITTTMDFFETLQILQFSKNCSSKNKFSYFFINPNFGEDKEISDDFYKQPIDITAVNILKNTKSMSRMHCIELLSRLIRQHNRDKIKLSKLDFARLKLRFILRKKVDLLKTEEDLIDHGIEDPDYMKNNEIAGYYGDVELSVLKNVFRNYFPIYQSIDEQDQVKETNNEATIAENIVENEVPYQEFEEIVHAENQPTENEQIEVKIDEIKLPEISNQVKNAEDDKENQPPPKKRRKRITRSGRITLKETNDALLNLQKEFNVISQ